MLLGIRAVIAESFERIHRSNLIGMGILPLEFLPEQNRATLGLSGEEIFDIENVAAHLEPGSRINVRATDADNAARVKNFAVTVRIDTPDEADYYRHGGILQYVLRQLRGAR
jgi:aconitate hydratase